MSISYTLLYVDNITKDKLFLSEPNPNFNKDLRETATRKHLYNLPASEMMTRLIKVYSFPISKQSVTKLDTALYFGPFSTVSSTATAAATNTSGVEDCVAKLFSKGFRTGRNTGVYNSNLDFDLSELMQEFSAASDVYFGWNNYYLCAVRDIRNYVMDKVSRKMPPMLSFDELSEKDLYLRERIANYEMHKNYNSWLWWMPIGYSGRVNQEAIAKQFIDDYLKQKEEEYEKAVTEQQSYEKDLDGLLADIELRVRSLPETASYVSIMLKTTR